MINNPLKNLMILHEYHLVHLLKQPIFLPKSMISKESTSITITNYSILSPISNITSAKPEFP